MRRRKHSNDSRHKVCQSKRCPLCNGGAVGRPVRDLRRIDPVETDARKLEDEARRASRVEDDMACNQDSDDAWRVYIEEQEDSNANPR